MLEDLYGASASVMLLNKDGDNVCFRHAVLRALDGEDINIELAESGSYVTECPDCSGESSLNDIKFENMNLRAQVANMQQKLDEKDRLISLMLKQESTDPEDAKMEKKIVEEARGKKIKNWCTRTKPVDILDSSSDPKYQQFEESCKNRGEILEEDEK